MTNDGTERPLLLKDPKTGRFIAGTSGYGRPKGSRAKLGEAFVAELYETWEKHGLSAIERVIAENPSAYLKLIAGLLPKDVNLNVRQLDDLTDDQLLARLRMVTEMARPLLASQEPV